MRHGIQVLGTVAFLLVGPLVLSGCLDGGTDYTATPNTEDGHGLVTIWVNRPDQSENYPIQQLVGVPRLVAFVAGSNDTKTQYGVGYSDIANGWPADWVEGNYSKEQWPITAERDWAQASSVWYQGEVPAGEYSVVRIEVMDVLMTFYTGGEAHAEVQGGRLSFAPGDGEYFVVEEGKELVLAMDSKLEEQGFGRFVIR